jgi:hypothetical protein
MSTKFEQLLDYLVNEEHEKANELFHEIVVEKSRDIYENLIAEEEDDEEMDESAESDEEEMDESADEEMDETVDLEDSYSMEADDEEDYDFAPGDATDEFGSEITGDEEDEESEEGEDSAIFDIKNAIADLEAAFAELEAAQDGEQDDMGMDSEFDDQEMDEPEDDGMMGFQEGRRMTREYVEKVGNDWEKNSQKGQGQYVGANTGEGMPAPVEGRSPISSGKGKPTTGANANNIAKSSTGEGAMDGTSPNAKVGGFLKSPQDIKSGNQNVPGGKVSVKGLSKVTGGHGAEKKGSGPGPVGSGTGDKAGQTSVSPIKPFLKKL